MVVVSMSADLPDPDLGTPVADPRAIRDSLPPALVAEFDREWEFVLERAKQDMDLAPIRSLLTKWRHVAHAELREPGVTQRLAEKVDLIQQTGQNPEAVSLQDVRRLIDQRLSR
jgi:hypothetical protein